MKNITSLKTLLLVIVASNSFAMGTVAETQMEKIQASNMAEYKPTGSYDAHINKRIMLGEYIPVNSTLIIDAKKSSNTPPKNFDAVQNKRLMLTENYPN